MTRRAAYGSGTKPAQRADGLWVARIEAGWTANGTRRRITVSAKTEAECKRRLKVKQRELAQGREHGLNVRETVKTWAETWLPQHARKVRPSTFTTDRGAVNKWIVPTLGHRRLSALTPGDLRALRDAITKPDPPRYPSGRSTTTALHAHKTLLTMLKDAIVEGHPVPPRIMATPKPGKATNDRAAIPLPDALRILELATARPDAALWVAALLQGMRRGEVLGLTWDCVDLAAATIDVSWQVQDLPLLVTRDRSSGYRVPDGFEARHLLGATHLTRPKTAAGKRVLPVVPWMAAALMHVRETWQPNPWGLVWTDTLTDGTIRPARPEVFLQTWKDLQAEAGVAHPSGRRYVLHEARHTTATLLLEAGVDRAVIEAILGQAVLVESYLHVGQEQARRALEGVAARLALG